MFFLKFAWFGKKVLQKAGKNSSAFDNFTVNYVCIKGFRLRPRRFGRRVRLQPGGRHPADRPEEGIP